MLLTDELKVRELLAAGFKYHHHSWHNAAGQPVGNDFRDLSASA
jgi:hypothetical protein